MLLERVNTKLTGYNSSTEQIQNKTSRGKNLDSLVRKGNEILKKLDPHTCCICQKVFSCRHSLKMHLETIHRKSTKFFCDLCLKFYFTKHAIRRHIKAVHSEKKFTCIVCGYKTSLKFELKRHKLLHEPPVSSESVNIELAASNNSSCKKILKKSDQSLNSLVRKGNESLKKSDPHTCFICQKVLSHRNSLKIHLKTVHCKSEKNFCNLCNKMFFNKHGMKDHMRRVHCGKSFACNVCEFICSRRDNLKRHKLLHAQPA